MCFGKRSCSVASLSPALRYSNTTSALLEGLILLCVCLVLCGCRAVSVLTVVLSTLLFVFIAARRGALSLAFERLSSRQSSP